MTSRPLHETDAQATASPRGPFVMTASGHPFFLFDPKPEEVLLRDIAHSLAFQCRWTGHTTRFLSVAEHCVYAAGLCPALGALLHDAPEAYVGDNSRPLKAGVSALGKIEQGIWEAIAARFNISPDLPRAVHEADQLALAAEIDQGFLAKPIGFEWERLPPAPATRLIGWPPERARYEFLACYHDLWKGKNRHDN